MRQVALTVCLLATTFTAFAQSDRGTITGTVSDPAGAVVAVSPGQRTRAGVTVVAELGRGARR